MSEPFDSYYRELLQSDREPKTIERYWQIVSTYRDWLADVEPDLATVKEFLAKLRGWGYRPATINLYYHALRQFFDFLGMPLKLKLRKEKRLPVYYDTGDLEALLAQARKGLYHHTSALTERNETMILTFAYTGIRKSELINLLVRDVDFNRRLIFIRQGKGRKDRVIPMAERLVVPLRRRCVGKSATDRVFDGLNARSVYRIITGLARACGLEGFHPHSLRHYFGTQLVERGANLRDVQELMGHDSLETTAVYLDVCAQRLKMTIGLLDSEAPLPSARRIHGRV